MKDFLHNTPLHIAATKNYISLAKFLIERYPSMLMATNGQGELPAQAAIRRSQDDVAAFLIRRMDHRRSVLMLLRCYSHLKILPRGSRLYFCLLFLFAVAFALKFGQKTNAIFMFN